MSTSPQRRPWWRRPVLVVPVLVVLLGTAMVQHTTFVGPDDTRGASALSSEEEATTLATDGYRDDVVPAITTDPAPIADVVTAAVEDPEAAGKDLGKHEAEGKPYSYAVTATGTVVEGEFGEIGLEVNGVPQEISLGVAVPPYGASSALRDVGMDVQYGDFENQIAYQGVAFTLNSLAAEDAYGDTSPQDLIGKRVTVQGATTWVSVRGGDVTHLTILPVTLEVAS